jgi:hypothetical protein
MKGAEVLMAHSWLTAVSRVRSTTAGSTINRVLSSVAVSSKADHRALAGCVLGHFVVAASRHGCVEVLSTAVNRALSH